MRSSLSLGGRRRRRRRRRSADENSLTESISSSSSSSPSSSHSRLADKPSHPLLTHRCRQTDRPLDRHRPLLSFAKSAIFLCSFAFCLMTLSRVEGAAPDNHDDSTDKDVVLTDKEAAEKISQIFSFDLSPKAADDGAVFEKDAEIAASNKVESMDDDDDENDDDDDDRRNLNEFLRDSRSKNFDRDDDDDDDDDDENEPHNDKPIDDDERLEPVIVDDQKTSLTEPKFVKSKNSQNRIVANFVGSGNSAEKNPSPKIFGVEDFDAVLESTPKTTPAPPTAGRQSKPRKPASSGRVRPQVSWGIPDAVAVVGAAFEFDIPDNAFLGDVASFVTTEAGDTRLPPWIDFDQKRRRFFGVATPDDAGQTYISVLALEEAPEVAFNASTSVTTTTGHSWSSSSSLAKDVFSITVRDSEDSPSSYALKSVDANDRSTETHACLPGEPRTVVTVVVDAPFASAAPADRLALLDRGAAAVGVPRQALRLLPPGGEKRRAFDAAALVAGPGNKKGGGGGALLQWQIGCGHDFTSENIALLETVERSSVNGTLASLLSRDVIGWHVTNQQASDRAARVKRAPYFGYGWRYTATLEPQRMAPTKAAVAGAATEGAEGPGRRIVPSQPSDSLHTPAYGGRHPHHRNHHHRGPKTHGRHHHGGGGRQYQATATLHPELPGGAGGIRPTPVIQAKPTDSYSGWDDQWNEGKLPDRLQPSSRPTGRDGRPTKQLPDGHDDGKPCKGKKCKPKPQTTSPPTKGPGGGGGGGVGEGMGGGAPLRPRMPFGKRPEIRSKLGEFNCVEGKYCEHQLPPLERLFAGFVDAAASADDDDDEGVGAGRKSALEVSLMRIDGLGLSEGSWIKYDRNRNMIYGLPLKGDVKPRTMEYVIAAMDSRGNVVRDAITVRVVHHPRKTQKRKKKFNHEFIFRFATDHVIFRNDVDLRIRFVRTLARIFGDGASMADIVMTKVKKGSTSVWWSNDSLPYSPCPSGDLKRLKEVVFDDDNNIRNSVVQPMARAGFVLNKIALTTHGPCASAEVLPAQVSLHDGLARADDAADPGAVFWRRDLFASLAPPVVGAAILLSAACIACLLYKKSRRGKFTLGEKRTFLNKGIPVIFVDELQENPAPPQTPLILKDEKPPLPPPSYPRSSNGIPASTPPSDHKQPIPTTDLPDAGDFPPLHDQLTSPNKEGLLATTMPTTTTMTPTMTNGNGTLGRGVGVGTPGSVGGSSVANGGPAAQTYRAPPPYMPTQS